MRRHHQTQVCAKEPACRQGASGYNNVPVYRLLLWTMSVAND